jgi:hypothetical protein
MPVCMYMHMYISTFCVCLTAFLGLKRLGREADHSPPSNAEVKECVELYLHSPSTPSWRGAQLRNIGTTLLLLTFTLCVCMSAVICKVVYRHGMLDCSVCVCARAHASY